ncbi:hypothetical protein [Fundidesulfovibrio soli]|uniref:hypothetical protein n=1 Tax=Fundidesulfovibrio soli TaxID=2922716 RepID=UPI001FAF471A|nr:hypothetical protein [Fundidesulfovibrio soli]
MRNINRTNETKFDKFNKKWGLQMVNMHEGEIVSVKASIDIVNIVLLGFDPIGIRVAIKAGFEINDIIHEYELEADKILSKIAAPMCQCKKSVLSIVIREVLNYYFAENYRYDFCEAIAEECLKNCKGIRDIKCYLEKRWDALKSDSILIVIE